MVKNQNDEDGKGFKRVSKYDKEFLILVLKCIKNDRYQRKIARSLTKKTGQKWYDSKVFYWISHLKSEDFIRESLYSSCKELELTDRGSKFLTECEVPNYDLHNLIVSFHIKNLGGLPSGEIPMKNWKYSKIDPGIFEARVHYGKPPKLKVYAPTTYGNSYFEATFSAAFLTSDIVGFIESRYGCEIDRKTIKIDRKAHLHPLKDPVLKELGKQGMNYNGKVLQLNQSGHAHGDILQDYVGNYEYMIQNFLYMMQHLGSIRMDSNRQWNAIVMIGETLNEIKKLLKVRESD